jgi:two-component sensor histidine kinase
MTFDRHGACLTVNEQGMKQMKVGTEIFGENFRDIWQDEQRALAEAEMQAVLKGEIRTFEAGLSIGGHSWWKVKLLPAEHGFVLIGEDVTEYRSLQNKLDSLIRTEEEYRRFKLIYDSMPDPVHITGSDYTVKFTNKACELGFGPSVPGARCYEYFHGFDDVCSWCRHEEVLGGKNLCLESFFERVGRHYESHMARITKPDGEVAKLVVLRDITERKNAEEALRKALHEKEMLNKEIHHRTKNNLAILQSLISLKEQSLGKMDSSKPYLKDIESRMLALSLLHEKLQNKETSTIIDAQEYMQSLARILFNSFDMDPGRVKLHVDVQDILLDANIMVSCGLIVNELLTNAFKYAFTDRREGEIRLEFHEDSPGSFSLRVSDNGTGMPARFEPKASESLGMTVIHVLAGQLDGQIEYNSTDKGTEFSISFKA